MTMARSIDVPHKSPVLADRRSFWPIFVLSFAVFTAIALVGAIGGQQWRSWLPGAEGTKSLLGGVKAAVWTFMSHIS
jgi:light-harvesting complex 1 beta chain